MTVTFDPDREPSFARYREQWEAGLLAQAIAENADLPPGHRKGVLRAWFSARYSVFWPGALPGQQVARASPRLRAEALGEGPCCLFPASRRARCF